MSAATIRGATASGHPAWAPLAPVLAAALLVGASGCGGPVRRAVAGSVTFDGQPLDEAVIMFVPLEAGGRKTGGQISAGRYTVPQEVGVFPGRYRVEVADDPPLDPTMRPDQVKSKARRKIPVLYSTSSPLTIEVGVEGSTDFDFQLLSKPRPTP
jgi:2-polyprenyl-6-methoxyphenol hydroxylase-like FAD-dependent oxidoreductase